MIRIFILHPHRLVREGWSAFLANHSDCTIAGQAADVDEALRLVDRRRVDIILTSDELAGVLNSGRLAAIRQWRPAARIVMVLAHLPEMLQKRLLKYGVRGFLFRDSSLSETLTAIRVVAGGTKYISNAHVANKQEGRAENPYEVLSSLTTREFEVLAFLVKGHTSREIAGMLGISYHTVGVHRKRILEKTKCANSSKLVNLFSTHGLDLL